MSLWKELLDSLDTSGGHIFVLSVASMVLLFSGHFFQMETASQHTELFLGALLLALKGTGKANGKGDSDVR